MKLHSNLSGAELYAMLKNKGISEYELAKELGLSRGIVHSRIYYYKKKHKIKGGGKPTTTIKEKAHSLDITHLSRIQSLAELIEAFDIDTSVWKAKEFTAEKWDSATDKTEKFLIKARFVERINRDIQPVLPVEVVFVPPILKNVKKSKDIMSSLLLFDPHFGFRRDIRTNELSPFHNRNALSIALSIAKDLQPDKVVWGGDFLDLAEWSDKFTQEPEFYFTTQNALFECAWWLAAFISVVPNAEFVTLAGNHEVRLNRAIMKRLLGAYMLSPADIPSMNSMSIDNLLGLSRLGITHIPEYPEGEYWICDDTKVKHGNIIRAKAGSTSSAVLQNETSNVIFGHKHSIERVTKIMQNGKQTKTVVAVCGGCLCNTDGSVPGSKKTQFQNAVVVVNHTKEKALSFDIIDIINDKAFYNSKLYIPEERVIKEAIKSCVAK